VANEILGVKKGVETGTKGLGKKKTLVTKQSEDKRVVLGSRGVGQHSKKGGGAKNGFVFWTQHGLCDQSYDSSKKEGGSRGKGKSCTPLEEKRCLVGKKG